MIKQQPGPDGLQVTLMSRDHSYVLSCTKGVMMCKSMFNVSHISVGVFTGFFFSPINCNENQIRLIRMYMFYTLMELGLG